MSHYKNHPMPSGMSKYIFRKGATDIKTINTSRVNYRGGRRL